MSEDPRISVVIPTRNLLTLLREAVQSVLDQGVRAEIVVIDDCSEDGTREWLATMRGAIRFKVNQIRLGSQLSRNRGLALASGRYVKFLDHDDVLLPGTLLPELDAAGSGWADIVVSGWEECLPTPHGCYEVTGRFQAPIFASIADDLLAGKSVPTGAALYHRRNLGGHLWDPAIQRLDDWDWFVGAALRARRIASCEHAAYQWRRQPRSVSQQTSRIQLIRDFYAILAKLEQALRARGEMTAARERRLAQYLYKELRWLARLQPARCDEVLAKIQALDRNFLPVDEEPNGLVRLACRVAGIRTTAMALGAIHRRLDRFHSRNEPA